VTFGPGRLPNVSSKPAGESSRSVFFLACFVSRGLSLDNEGEGDSGLLMARERKVRVEEARLRRRDWVTLQVKATLSRTEEPSSEV
jgi:hypothetical protein